MDWLTDPQVWLALVTLTALEIVLGIDNIIFISIQAGKLPAAQQEKARLVGLSDRVGLVDRRGLDQPRLRQGPQRIGGPLQHPVPLADVRAESQEDTVGPHRR